MAKNFLEKHLNLVLHALLEPAKALERLARELARFTLVIPSCSHDLSQRQSSF